MPVEAWLSSIHSPPPSLVPYSSSRPGSVRTTRTGTLGRPSCCSNKRRLPTTGSVLPAMKTPIFTPWPVSDSGAS